MEFKMQNSKKMVIFHIYRNLMLKSDMGNINIGFNKYFIKKNTAPNKKINGIPDKPY